MFPANPDLADILGRLDFDFEFFIYFLDFWVPKFPDFQVPRFPETQPKLGLGRDGLGLGRAGPGLGRAGP